jgi:hypothetical protein
MPTSEMSMSRKIETPKTPEANPPVTLTPQALQALIEEVTALRAAVAKAETVKLSVAGKTDRAIKNEIQTVRAFKKIGINATPHVDTFTFNIWISKGFRPKEGSKSVRVNNLRLFHQSQVRKLSKEELAATKEQQQAAIKRHDAKVVPIGTSPQ